MKLTPELILDEFDKIWPLVYVAYVHGIEYADLQLFGVRVSYLWSHLVRHGVRQYLIAEFADIQDWKLDLKAPQSAVHLIWNGLHRIRIRASFAGTTPAPGQSAKQKHAWKANQYRMRLPVGAEIDGLPPLEFVIDWVVGADGTPEMHLALPTDVWIHGNHPVVAWRERLQTPDIYRGVKFVPPDEGYVLEPREADESKEETH